MEIFPEKIESFGLDISDFSLKIAFFKKNKNKIYLASYSEEKIPDGVVSGGEIKDTDALAKIIINAINNAKGEKIKTKYVSFSLPEEKSFLDVIQLPFIEGEELKTAVGFEIDRFIPMKIEDVYFDYQKTGEISGDKKAQEILVAAVPKKIVDNYITTIKKANLIPLFAEVECMSIVRSLIKKEEVGLPVLIIDFGASRTTFIIFSGKTIRFTSTIQLSSKELTDILSKKLSISKKEASEIKKEEGLLGRKAVRDMLLPTLNNLIMEINNYLDYYKSHEVKEELNVKMEKIILCGGGANLNGLAEFLSEKIMIRVELGNPWVNILPEDKQLSKIPPLPKNESLRYATAIGLALRNIIKED